VSGAKLAFMLPGIYVRDAANGHVAAKVGGTKVSVVRQTYIGPYATEAAALAAIAREFGKDIPKSVAIVRMFEPGVALTKPKAKT